MSGPALSRYLRRLEQRLVEAGYHGPILIIQSHGGVAPIAESARLAAGGVLSGPAGGVAGSRYATQLLGSDNLIPFDMGGTSTDICLIVDGEPALVSGRGIGGHRLALNSLDIVSLGAGGGSIGRVDTGGILHVGPQSAGAIPGPACYGRGGSEATVTDANLILGYLDPAHFLGGSAKLHARAAEAALERLAAALRVDRIAAAEGVHRVVNTNMAEGIRLVSVRRGVDPRRFALLSFGGAAGLHVTDVARQLDLTRVVVPRVAAVLSAWGMLATDLRFEVSRTHIGDTARLDGAGLKRLFAEMEQEGLSRLRASFDGPVRMHRSVEMRYGEQIFEITVPLDDIDWDADDPLPQIVERFHDRHEGLYTYALAGPGRGAGERARCGDRRAAGRATGTNADGPRRCRSAWRTSHLAARLGHRASVRVRHIVAGSGDRRSGDRRISDDHGAAATRKPRDGDAAWVAGYRGVTPPPLAGTASRN